MMMDDKLLEIYIHIPFCVRKCNYCDFLSAPATREVQEKYMAALFSEIEGRAEKYSEYTIVSVFIGGGTPSVVEAKWIAQLMTLLKEKYSFAEDAEITIEVNPGTVDEEKLRCYYEAGINRLSIGMQSANEQELCRLGRIHSYEQFAETYREARAAGFGNINVDVMSALPGQNLCSYRETLGKVLTLNPPPEHISAYSLIVEEGTPFARWQEEGSIDVPDEDTERRMYEVTREILDKAGYHRYEISNYAREGCECRHNLGYWRRVSYVGFGIGAASMVKNVRFCNGEDLQEYLAAPLDCVGEYRVLSTGEQMEEFMFLGLRCTKGVSEQEFETGYGCKLEAVYQEVIARNIGDGLLCYEEAEEGTGENVGTVRYLRLTSKGLDLSNYVMAQFLFDEA